MGMDLLGDEWEKLVFIQHQLAGVGDCIEIALPGLALDHFTHLIHAVGIVDIDDQHRFCREVFGDTRTTIIDRHRPGQKTIGKLLAPIISVREILDCQ